MPSVTTADALCWPSESVTRCSPLDSEDEMVSHAVILPVSHSFGTSYRAMSSRRRNSVLIPPLDAMILERSCRTLAKILHRLGEETDSLNIEGQTVHPLAMVFICQRIHQPFPLAIVSRPSSSKPCEYCLCHALDSDIAITYACLLQTSRSSALLSLHYSVLPLRGP
ncbi:hypothetical protein BC629DRAFT_647810 [Irpex lacteus]|nr:hypothetical protein BC629DRAFT_647810 [Irpex lacteus]